MNKVVEKIVKGIKDYFTNARVENAVIGMAGGVDSAVVCILCAKALGPGQIHAFHLPYFDNPNEWKHAQDVAQVAGVKITRHSIKNAVDVLCQDYGITDKVRQGNAMARLRMIFFYEQARKLNALVVGTGNKSELLTGYFTKYGDGGVDLLPIAALYKKQVRQLAHELGVPQEVIEKKPSAGLWEGQTDEGELGVSYEELDKILAGLVDEKKPAKAVAEETGVALKQVLRLKNLVEKNAHKTRMPPVISI